MSLSAIVGKELGDLLREKRFGGWALTFLGIWALILFLFLQSLSSSAEFRRDHPMDMLQLALPIYFFLALSFVVLALFTLTDGISKERESGMLPVVGAKPIVRWHVVLAKLLTGLVVYVGALLVTLLPAGVMAASLGTPFLSLIVRLFALPLLSLYVFMLGLGLLLGVAFHSSKSAIGTGVGVFLPLFLLIEEGPMFLVYRSYPELLELASFTPFQAGLEATMVIAYGGTMPWSPLLFVAGVGALMAALAFWLFQRQEVAS